MATTVDQPERARELWRRCLASAVRTAVACTIVGCATLFGPAWITRQVAFPAFSYVTAILIVTDSALGGTVRGCWLGLYATIQGVCPAILSLSLIGPARLSAGTTALMVAVSAFVVVLPESTHIAARRIALGQIVIVYVLAFINGVRTDTVMHPLHIAASTALGVLACVLAVLVPYPSLACSEVKKNCKLFSDNASARLKLYVKAFCAEDNPSALALISQAKLSAVRGTKYLQIIKCKQESMQWERLPWKPYLLNAADRLQEQEMPLRGLEMALTSSSIPVQMLDQELKEGALKLEKHIGQTMKKVLPFDSSAAPEESNTENMVKFLQTLPTIPQSQKGLPCFFFLFCLMLLLKKSTATSLPPDSATELSANAGNKSESWLLKGCTNYWISNKRLMPAFKCSISLGLAVLFGLIYSKENGYWSGLPVALSFAATREATFKAANIKAQGTVLGSVYGVLGCFVFERFVQIRFLSLLPWFIFTSFLRRSHLYGQAGGISAVVGAVLILGRKNYGPPSEFAIVRIVETFIGLSCSIMVEILLQPTRASTLAKFQLPKSLQALHESLGAMSLIAGKKHLEASRKKLKANLNELKQFIGEAEAEPNFWFLPFHGACYRKLVGSLSKIEDLLLFAGYSIGFLEQESCRIEGKETVNKIEEQLQQCKRMICSSIKCFEEVTSIKSLQLLDKEIEKKNISYDVELGKSPRMFLISGSAEDEINKIISCYLQHAEDAVECCGNEEKIELGLSLSALAFCMGSMVRETLEIERNVQELVQWENPSSQVNLVEISCKLHACYK
ncbi:uncharacterized protein LOC127797020 [Diospyros lotus]|uniref:uncharacterized protein LOC127797020 n=1 Tax=Diospyros lotus TaxID=55363 RepID=UPI00225C3709|nr:uncharacterized protein LOC127797020 [Diospyros lotus]